MSSFIAHTASESLVYGLALGTLRSLQPAYNLGRVAKIVNYCECGISKHLYITFHGNLVLPFICFGVAKTSVAAPTVADCYGFFQTKRCFELCSPVARRGERRSRLPEQEISPAIWSLATISSTCSSQSMWQAASCFSSIWLLQPRSCE